MSAAAMVPLVFLLPLAAAALLPALFGARPRLAWYAALAVALATTVAAAVVAGALPAAGELRYAVGGWAAPLGIELRFDRIAAVTVAFGAVTALAITFSRTLTDSVPRPVLFYTLVLVNLGGLNGFALAADLFNLFVFMELLSVSAYALVAATRQPGAALAAIKYLLPGAVSSLLVLFAIGVLFALTGSLNMADVGARLAGVEAPAAVALALGALTVGFLVKAALFPLHFWLPDAHSAAPGPVSALLSALVVKVGVLGLLRTFELFGAAAGPGLLRLETLLTVLGAVAVVAGAVAAVVQHELKRMLAYSTVSNIGYIVLGLGLATTASVAGSIAHVFYHGLTKAGLFLAAAALVDRTGLHDIDDLRGLGHRMPWSATALSAGMIAVAGVPPTAGFVGKWQIALGALEGGRPLPVTVLLVTVVLGGALLALAYGIRVINALFFRAPTHHRVVAAREAPLSMLVPLVVLIGLALSAGLSGAAVIEFVRPVAEAFVGR
ncbi:MAG: proton-conducting transporter membrane subunit [Wenzhouxiangellaceae bacterium]|nr:proton-conducting transporter membrane subunit [Wenzhouxiangellaceae bacterium]